MKLCGFDVGLDRRIFLIAGPCVAESEQMCLDIAGQMKGLCAELGITRQTLYRHVTPTGEIRPDGEKLLGRVSRRA